MSKIILTDVDPPKYEPIKQGPIAKLGGTYKYFGDKLGHWVRVYIGPEFYGVDDENLGWKFPTAKNFYEIDDIKQGRKLQEVKKPKKKGRKP